MKRTFGRIISLALVLTLLLSMVPAALAATTGTGTATSSTVYMAPGQKEPFKYEKTLASGVTEENLYWVSSNTSAATVDSANKTSGNKEHEITAVAAGTTYIRVYKDQDTYEKNKTSGSNALYSWEVKVTAWTLTLKFGSSTDATINSGSYQTLTATVTGPAGLVSGAKVKFESSDKSIAYLDTKDSKTATKTVSTTGTSTTATSGTATANVYGGTKGGYVTITATVTVDGKSNNVVLTSNTGATKEVKPYVNGPEGWAITLPDSQKNLTVKYGDNTTYLKPSGGPSGATYVYYFVTTSGGTETLSTSSNYMQIAENGRITPYKTCSNQKVRVYVKGYAEGSYPYAETSITISNTTATGLAIDYNVEATKFGIQNGTIVLAAKDTDKTENVAFDSTGIILTELALTATVTSTSADDVNRVKWTTSNASIAKFGSEETYIGKTAPITATGKGTVTITATIDNISKSMTLDVWSACEYDSIVTKPDIPSSISSREDAFNDFRDQLVTVHLSRTDGTVSLPLKDVQHVSTSDGTIKLEGTVNGFDRTNKIAYFPKGADNTAKTALATIESRAAKLSNIMITSQPQDASYKLDATVGTLSIQASVGTGYSLSTFTWYDNNKVVKKTETVPSGTKTYTSTLKLSDFVQSAGSYGFYCVITDSQSGSVESRTALVTIGGDYNIKITAGSTSTKPGSSVSLSAVAQQYNPSTKGYTNVTGKSYTVTWTVSDTSLATITGTGNNVTLKAKSGGTVTVKAETTIDGNKYEGSQTITITVPTAETVQLMLEDGANYVLLDGSKLSDAVKTATSTTPSTFSFTQPSGGTIYSSSSLSSSITSGSKYSSSDVSRMAFKPTGSAASYTISYSAYGSDGQIASGSILVMTNSGAVSYHISANESQSMQVSDFRSVYGSGTLNYVVFGTSTDSRGILYKGKTSGSGKVGSESYYASSGTNLLSNVTFIAGSSTVKYTVTIPFTAYGSSGTVYGNLVIYVNDTHSIYSTGATFSSMGIADEIAPETGASSAYVTIDSVIGGKLYTSYSSIKSGTALASKDYGSTKFYLSGSNSVNSLYVLPIADSKTVDVNYTLNGSTKGTISFKVIEQTASSKFSDVSGSSKWAANSVDFMYSNGLVNGVTTTSFGPTQNMTRAMLVTILYRAAGEPSVTGIANKFTDNKENQYYYNAVLWASSKGIVTGASATTFDPDGLITREQIAAILYRYAGSPTVTGGSLSGFSDQSQISSYAVTAMQWAVGKGLITGVSTNGRTTLSAKNNATRAQVSVMLHRFLTFD